MNYINKVQLIETGEILFVSKHASSHYLDSVTCSVLYIRDELVNITTDTAWHTYVLEPPNKSGISIGSIYGIRVEYVDN